MPEHDDVLDDEPTASSATARRAPSRVRAGLTAALAVLLVVGVVVVGYLGYRTANPTEEPFSPTAGAPLPSQRERAEVVAVAEQFTLRMDNVDGSKFDDYVAGISELLTTKARAENKQSLESLKEAYQAAEVKGTGEVLVTGVSALSTDSATVLVAHDADVTTTQGDIEHHYRWSIDLAKVDGDWLVDGFTPVT